MNIILEMLVQCDTNVDLNLCIYVSDLYFMVGDFALYPEDYLLDKCHNWDIDFMWCKDLPDLPD